ncbi:vascular endothelial growth factor receptor 2 [Anabrus simplex]|uniref:vascular endothelial growth factor receptor 2 n=1 Tax=Anabrus simplex TaxID=316456 RepID=UPI0035A3BDA8
MAKPMITSNSEPNPAVGDDLILTCTVSVDFGISFSIEWDIPSSSRAHLEERVVKGNSSSYVEDKLGRVTRTGVRRLTVYNITKGDEGPYVCRVEDHAGNKNNHTKIINVHDKNDSYIKFLVGKDETTITDIVGMQVQWVVNLESYPKATLTWYKPDNTPIKPGKTDKYEMEIREHATSTKLVINDIKFYDRGIYRLEANNQFDVKIENFTLIVKGKPRVDLQLNKSYAAGRNYSVICTAEGYPIPNITWYFRPCYKTQECSFTALPASDYITEQVDDANVRSTLNILANVSGNLNCSAANDMGENSEISGFLVTDVNEGEIFDAWGPDLIIIGDTVTLKCGASKENYTQDSLHWYKIINGTKQNIESLDYKVTQVETDYSYQIELTIPNIQKSDNGEFECFLDDEDRQSKAIRVDVQTPKKPELINTNINTTEKSLRSGEPLHLICSYSGIPPPTIKWYKDGVLLQKPKYKISERGDTLTAPFINSEDEGKYECKAENRAGVQSKEVFVKLKDKPGPDVGMIAAVIIFVLILIVLVVVLIVKIRKERILRRELAVAGLKNFEEGAMQSLNPELCVDEQAELLPYDRKWEFPRSKLKLGKQLGAGAFGVVMKGQAFGIVEGEDVTTVAVKMVKRNAEFTYVKALASELKIMVHLGKHLNVVNLLGACTSNIAKRELYVIVEYCRFGNLHNYLLRHRENFIDQVDAKTGKIDSTIGAEILSRADSFSNKASGDNARSAPDDMVVDYRVGPLGSQSSDGSNMDGNISMSPVGEDSCLMSNNSAQPEWRSNYRGDYRGTVRPICTQDLVCWAFQVARGMEYLAGRKVLHGDLAARNVLLADHDIVKICDFGLAKSMYKSDNYKKKGDGPLPIKWMAVESIRDRVFSTQSDVWSFGIVLWELFSLARTPYPGMEADEKLYNKLLAGYRMEKPPFATDDIYNTMKECWEARPDSRPTFSTLSVKLGGFLEESIRQHFIDLNDPYIVMNEQWLQDRGNDYLNMMTAPTYNNLVSPVNECDNDYVNSFMHMDNTMDEEEAAGYLCMKGPSTSNSPNIFSPRVAAVGDTVFNFSTPQQQRKHPRDEQNVGGPEMHPILKTPYQGSESDSECANELRKGDSSQGEGSTDKTHPSFSNACYYALPTISTSADNYIDMPKHKSAASEMPKNGDISFTNEELPTGFSNPSYITMGLMGEDTNSSTKNPFSTPEHSITAGGNNSYVNFPS